ncbi:TonB-dependent receptor [Mucilaginibacter terrae]|uniref:TonB-dependent receptor n=1 Tax=Mucilaginibacter terrae TaxID=1955052 RepID=UPI003632D02A
MKISLLAVIITLTSALSLLAGSTHGQSIQDVKVSLDIKRTAIERVLADLEKTTKYHFVYENNLLKGKQTKGINVKDASLQMVLMHLLHPVGLSFVQIGKSIVLNEDKATPKSIASPMVQGQAIQITGKVTDEKNDALSGVTVSVKERRSIVMTNNEGLYSIAVETGETLIYSFIGYKTITRTVNNATEINVRLEPESSQLADIVVVGYGTQTRRDVTTAISSLKSGDINNFPATGVDKAMTGKMAGVQILQPNGAPGAPIAIAIRGKATITAGSDPLYVIDGLPLSDNSVNGPGLGLNPLNAINVNDIESVDVLKDASAAAIYGSRGSNGVVIITTKRGKKDKPVINYNAFYGFQETNKKIRMLDAYEYSRLIYDAHNNTYFDLLADRNLTGSADDNNATRLSKLGAAANSVSQSYLLPPEIFPYLNGQTGLTNTDWQDAIFRKAPTQSHTLSVTGGSDNVKYYVSGNFMDQQGVVLESGFKRYGGRVNLDASYGKFKLGTSINYTYQNLQFQPTEGRFSSNENIVSGALTASPFFPVYNANGSYNFNQYNWQYGQSQSVNPVALAKLKSDLTAENKMLGNIFAQYNFTPELSNKISFGVDIDNFNRSAFRPSTLPQVSPSLAVSIPTGNYRNTSLVNWVAENTLAFNKQWGQHSIKAIASVSAQRESRSSQNVSATGFPNDLVKTLNAATAISSFSSQTEEWSLLSGLTRVQYNFNDRYLLSAAVRADGSSRFGPSKKYGYFPSVSAGWNIDREKFMQDQKLISSLKLRASYGLTGNFQINNYAYLSVLSQSNYVFGPPGSATLASGLYQSTAGNDDLGWERTSAFNIGTDIGFFDERLHATIDVYNNNTSNILLQVPVPQSSGYNTNIKNIGKVNNKGLEISLSGDNRLGAFRLTNSANISFNRNKVLDLGGPTSIITQAQGVIYFITQVGQPIGNYYTLVYNGVYKSQAELNDPANAKVAGAKVGDFKFIDQNGDGIIDGSNDRAITGNYMPKFTYGFSSQLQYRFLDLNVALQGIYGNKIANIQGRYINSGESFVNNTTDALNRFYSEAEPGNGLIARANRNQRGLNATISTYGIEDGSYLRVRDLTLGATLPVKWVSKAGFSKVRLYFTATNLFTFTKYSAYNPEISSESNPLTPGVDYGSYPLSKSYVFGLNLSL